MSASALRRARWLATEYLPAALLFAGIIVFWELWVRVQDTPAYRLPAPSRIWDAFQRTRETLPDHTVTTVTESLLGLAFGAGIGVALAALIASIPLARRVLYPIFVVSQTIPMIVLAPLLVIWFGLGMEPKVIVVALISFFPVVVSTTEALLNADREMLGLIRSMGANRLQELRYVLIPSALPGLFAGLKIAAAYAVSGAVIAEWMGASSGLGLYITRSSSSFRTDQVFVAIVVIAVLSILLFGAVHLIARATTPWMFVKEGDNR